MNGELFRAARDYHGAIAAYCRALKALENLESLESLETLENLENLAQDVLGASLRYRAAVDRLIACAPGGSNDERLARRRLAALRSLLHFTSRRYNLVAKLHRLHP